MSGGACSEKPSCHSFPGVDTDPVTTSKTPRRSAAARPTDKKAFKPTKKVAKATKSRKAVKPTSKAESRAPSPEELQESLDEAERRLATYHRYFAEGEKDDIYFRLTRDIVLVTRRWRKFANSRISTLGQTMARWETLYLVAFSGEDLSQGGLAQLVGIEGPTMVRMLELVGPRRFDRAQPARIGSSCHRQPHHAEGHESRRRDHEADQRTARRGTGRNRSTGSNCVRQRIVAPAPSPRRTRLEGMPSCAKTARLAQSQSLAFARYRASLSSSLSVMTVGLKGGMALRP